MTNLEKYNRIIKRDLKAADEDLNDEVMAYLRYKHWESVVHVEMVADLEEAFGVMFSTIDITSFSTYSRGIEILRSLGVDMDA